MRINCHSHVFNVKAVFTPETVRILLDRLRRQKFPKAITQKLADELVDYLSDEGLTDGDAILKRILEEVDTAEKLSKLLGDLGDLAGASVSIDVGGKHKELTEALSRWLLGKTQDILFGQDDDATQQGLSDYVDCLRIILQPTIRDVADIAMKQLEPSDGLVALTMDITQGGTQNEELFKRQLRDTSDLVYAYPGRIFPFVAANPMRSDFFDHVQRALLSQGFVGVKLYPSLGYDLNADGMDDLYTYCEKHSIPVMIHCNKGGFYADKTTIGKGEPVVVEEHVLKGHPNLRVCFGHAGGDENMIQAQIPQKSWTRQILALMKKYPGVYMDLSFATDAMIGNKDLGIDKKAARANYFRNLKALLTESPTGNRILFGTDFWLVRQVAREGSYWKFFTRAGSLTDAQFKRIAIDNAATFVGLPKAGQPLSWTMANYVDFAASKQLRVERDPAPWLLKAARAKLGPTTEFTVTGTGATWPREGIHLYVFAYLQDNQFFSSQIDAGWSYEDYGRRLQLRDLQYWNAGFEAGTISEKKRKDVATGLHAFLKTNGFKPRATGSKKNAKTVAKLIAALSNGTSRLYEFSETCAQLYKQ